MREVKVTIEAIIEVDENLLDIYDLEDKVVICFRNEDEVGIETFIPFDEGLSVTEYISTTIDPITEIY